MLEAIAYFHSLGYIHRDIKLANILLKDKNDLSSVKIVDFGLTDVNSSNNTDLNQHMKD